MLWKKNAIIKWENRTDSKHTINGFDNRLDTKEQKTSELEDRAKENIPTKVEREKELRQRETYMRDTGENLLHD